MGNTKALDHCERHYSKLPKIVMNEHLDKATVNFITVL